MNASFECYRDVQHDSDHISVSKKSVDQYIVDALQLNMDDDLPKASTETHQKGRTLLRVPIDSPTKKLIKFQNKRLSEKQEIARWASPHGGFDRMLVYSNRPKVNFETCLGRLEAIEGAEEASGVGEIERDYGNTKESIEKSLAAELLPILKEKMLKM